MKTQLFLTAFITLILCFELTAQVEIDQTGIDIKTTGHLSEISINGPGNALYSIYVEADATSSASAGIVAKANDVPGFGHFTYGIIGEANVGSNANRSLGIYGLSLRPTPIQDGRTTGVQGLGGNATDGANRGVYGILQGSNTGSAVLGYDQVGFPGWSQVTNNTVSYAGYFRGKGYFHDNLGIGEDNPQSKVHVKSGDVYIEGSANGIILESAAGGCYRLTVDNAGNLVTTSVPCP